jgi:hypothetical protein
MKRDYLISVYCEGYAYFLTGGLSSGHSVFGGPPAFKLAGIPGTILAADELQYVGHVSHHDIPPLAPHLSEIPLFYGFTFDGCELRYELQSSSKANLMDLCPARPLPDYPYPDFPAVFPRIPLRLGNKRRMTYAHFREAYANLSEDQPADVILMVPPALSAGISMWGEFGDAEDVTVVFEYDFLDGTVRAYNHCT